MKTKNKSTPANQMVESGLSTRCAHSLERQQPLLASKASKGAWQKCEGYRKAKVARVPSGTKVKGPSSFESAFSSPDYEDDKVLIEGV